MVPIIERQVLDQGLEMLKERPPRRQCIPNGAVNSIDTIQRRMNQEGQQDTEGGKTAGLMGTRHGLKGRRIEVNTIKHCLQAIF
jgi:hypothetical protein